MTYIRIDTKTKQASTFVELIETMPFAKILADPNISTKRLCKVHQKVKPKCTRMLQS